jgi:hypothetical protein
LTRAADVVLVGRFEPIDLQRYRHVPFVAPAGARQLHLRYSYSDQIDSDPLITGGNTLDLGLFDDRGIATGSPGFRGWSGSEKMAVTIDADWATPPYRPGAIGAGTWHVLLGPYKVAPQGCDWRVEIWFDLGVPREERTVLHTGSPTRRPLMPPVEPGWVRGDLHCHTLYSDGDSWPSEILLAAAEAGLAFLGVTDHNSVAHHAEYGAGGGDYPVVIPGVEVTTYRGHWNAWGTERWYEFREPTSVDVTAAMREAIGDGALVSVCHPKPFGPPWEYAEVRGYPAIEVWNGPWERLNSESLRFWEAHLRRGERIVAVGGSDTHQLRAPHHARLGLPTTWVKVGDRLTADAVLEAIRSGEVFLSASPAGPQLYLSPDRVRVVGAQGAILALVADGSVGRAEAVDAADWERPIAPARGARYVRAQLMDTAGALLALSNPLWL